MSDDIKLDLSPDRVLISRVGGLTLTPPATMMAADDKQRHIASVREALFDPQGWGADRHANFVERKHELILAAAEAPETRRTDARLELARLYLTREMFAEAKGVLDVALIDERPKPEEVGTLVLRALANILMGRADEGLRDLGNPMIGDRHEASLWRAFAFAQQGRWNEAHQGFKANQAIVPQLPVELQRLALTNGLRAAIEVKDFNEASERVNEFQIIGIPDELQPTIDVLLGRMAEGLGRVGDALTSYRAARGSANRIAAAQAELRELVVRHSFGDIKRNEVIASLETLTTLWRGDETEIEALRILASMYTAESRYRNAFQVMRTALLAHPNAGLTRRIQEEAAGTFEELYLGDRGDLLMPIEALAMFYEYKMLTPIGRRGDEMIRRLADRLVSVDLLNQAAELLQHQVDHRLQGAGRAQVGARLAMIYLFNRKPELALKTLRGTRAGDLATEVRNQRLLIEARALSDTGRHDLAVELINTREGAEAERLRADIFWSAGRHREAAEQIERMYGMRWKEFTPLTPSERADLLRAAIGYSLANDGLGLDRFRQKYAAKMAETPDRRAFEIVTAPLNTGSAEFRDVVKSVTAIDTLEAFLSELRSRYPTPPARTETPAPGAQSDAPNPVERTAARN